MIGWTNVQSSGSETGLKKIMSFMHLKHLMKKMMKQFRIEVSHASPGQLQTIAAELKIMSNGWTKYGPRILINGQKLQAPALHVPRTKRQATSLTSSKH